MTKLFIRGLALSAFALSAYLVDVPVAEAAKLNCGSGRSQCIRWCDSWTETWAQYNQCRNTCLAIYRVCVEVEWANEVSVRDAPSNRPPVPTRPGNQVIQPNLLENSPGLSPQGPAGTGSPTGPGRPAGPVLR